MDRLTYYLDWLTFALVVVGIAGLALTYKLERPWLIPLVSDENTESIGQMFRRVAAKDDLLIPEVCLAIANHGRVPAWIIERYIDLRTFEGELPADPPYRPEDVERPAPTPVPDAKPVQQVSRVLFYGPDSLARVNDGETRLVFFGYVKYRGIWGRFGRTMETRFCWLTTRKVVSGRPGGLPDRPIIRFEHGGPRNWTRYT